MQSDFQDSRKEPLSDDFAKRFPLAILVAEDNPINTKVIGKVLERLGYAPVFAQNGRDALLRLADSCFDVILMDIQMPEMDGLEATRIIRSSVARQPKIVAMTANAMMEDKEECLRAGMDFYVSKPLQLTVLKQLLVDCCSDTP